jgi:hypothetical protein
MRDLEKRVNRLNKFDESSLTTKEANAVRWFWIQLHHTPEEAEEHATLQQRQDALFENYKAGNETSEEQQEWTKNESRIVEIAHNTMQRVSATHALRDRVWPELAPRNRATALIIPPAKPDDAE